jgi:hypothetical protein
VDARDKPGHEDVLKLIKQTKEPGETADGL